MISLIVVICGAPAVLAVILACTLGVRLYKRRSAGRKLADLKEGDLL